MKTQHQLDLHAAVLEGKRTDTCCSGGSQGNFRAEELLRRMLPAIHFLLLAIFAMALTSCAQNPPHSASGKKMQLETIYHGPTRQPTYLYREVN